MKSHATLPNERKFPCFKILCKSIEIGCNNPQGITRQNGENVSISLQGDLQLIYPTLHLISRSYSNLLKGI